MARFSRVLAFTFLGAAIGAAACSPNQPAPASTEAPATPAAAEGSEGTLYATNEIGGDLSVVDVATQKVIATIPLGKRPRGLAFSPDGALLYVALSGSPLAPPGVDESTLPPPDKSADGIGVVDVKTRTLLRVMPGGSDPEQVAVSKDGTKLFVANEDVALASVLDAGTGAVIATVKVGGEPEGVNLDPSGNTVWVTSEEEGAAYVIDATTHRLLKKVEVGPRPRSTAFLPDGSRAYVPAENGGEVRAFDTKTYALVATIKLNGQLQRPMGGVVSSDGKFLFMTTGRGKTVAIIDLTASEHVASVEVGDRPWGIAISADGKRLFTANGQSNDVSLVDVGGRRVIAKVKVGDRPWGIAYRP